MKNNAHVQRFTNVSSIDKIMINACKEFTYKHKSTNAR